MASLKSPPRAGFLIGRIFLKKGKVIATLSG